MTTNKTDRPTTPQPSALRLLFKQRRIYRRDLEEVLSISGPTATKILDDPLRLDGYYSHQTLAQRSGGCWTAGRHHLDLKLVKALSTYMCWTQARVEGSPVHIINCYLEPGEAEKVRN
jgi:hypothetical protein